MDYLLAFIVAIVIAVAITVLVLLLTLNNPKKENVVPNTPTVTLTCNSNFLDKQDLPLPSSSTFNIETSTLGSGFFALFFYSDAEYTNLISSAVVETNVDPIEINLPEGTKGIQYIFLCSAVDRVITVSTPAPTPLIPYIPYGFKNGSIASNLSVTVSGTSGSQTLTNIAAGNTGYPNPPYGWDLYTATLTP